MSTKSCDGHNDGGRPSPEDLVEAARVEPDPPPKKRFAWRSAAELWNEPPPPQWVEGLFGPGGFVILFGPPDSGKTFVALDLMARCSQGLGLFAKRFPITLRMTCGYATTEGRSSIGLRHRAACESAGHDGDGFYILKTVPNLMLEDDVTAFIEDTLSVGVPMHIIALDTLAESMQGGDENAQKDAGVVCGAVRRIQRKLGEAWRFEPVVLLVHHTNKGGEMRGSTVFKGAADAVLRVRTLDGARTFDSDKMKDFPKVEPLEFELFKSDGLDTMAVNWLGPRKADAVTIRERVIQALREHADGRGGAKSCKDLLPFVEGPASRPRVSSLLSEMRANPNCAVQGFQDESGWLYYIEE